LLSQSNSEPESVYRVNWLRAKGRFDRWKEELEWVMNEMHWTILWFENQRKTWVQRSQNSEEKGQQGQACYAWKQVEMWETLRKAAEREFSKYIE